MTDSPSRGHYRDWLHACRGGEAPWANFDYAATFNEFLMLGDVATRFAGETLDYDHLAGKILKVPIYILLGGKFRDRLLIYHDTGSPKTADPRPWVEEAQRSRSLGFQAMKFDLDWESRAQGLARREPYKYRGEVWNRNISSIEMEQWVKILEAIRDAARKLGTRDLSGCELYGSSPAPQRQRRPRT